MICRSTALPPGFPVNFPEKSEAFRENIREIGPNIMFSPPRIWENMTSTVQVKVMDASRLKRTMYNWALPVGYEYADTIFRKQHPGPLLQLKHRLGFQLVFRGPCGTRRA